MGFLQLIFLFSLYILSTKNLDNKVILTLSHPGIGASIMDLQHGTIFTMAVINFGQFGLSSTFKCDC